jgi:hypothetical protein
VFIHVHPWLKNLRAGPTIGREKPAPRRERDPGGREVNMPRREGSTASWETTPEHWEGAPERWGAAPERWEVTPEHWDSAPEHRETTPERREAAPERWEVAPECSGVPSQRSGPPSRQATLPSQPPRSPSQRPFSMTWPETLKSWPETGRSQSSGVPIRLVAKPCVLEMKIAQHLSAGLAGGSRIQSRQGRQKPFFRPSGTLVGPGAFFPALKCWAIFKPALSTNWIGRPSGGHFETMPAVSTTSAVPAGRESPAIRRLHRPFSFSLFPLFTPRPFATLRAA